jgi:hypothetical protein
VPNENPKQWLTTAEAAEYVRLAIKTLKRLRALGKGPRWHSPEGSRTIRHAQADLDTWLQGGAL